MLKSFSSPLYLYLYLDNSLYHLNLILYSLEFNPEKYLFLSTTPFDESLPLIFFTKIIYFLHSSYNSLYSSRFNRRRIILLTYRYEIFNPPAHKHEITRLLNSTTFFTLNMTHSSNINMIIILIKTTPFFWSFRFFFHLYHYY